MKISAGLRFRIGFWKTHEHKKRGGLSRPFFGFEGYLENKLGCDLDHSHIRCR